jgi:hypothetical protein
MRASIDVTLLGFEHDVELVRGARTALSAA